MSMVGGIMRGSYFDHRIQGFVFRAHALMAMGEMAKPLASSTLGSGVVVKVVRSRV
jgi:hypothetical protein